MAETIKLRMTVDYLIQVLQDHAAAGDGDAWREYVSGAGIESSDDALRALRCAVRADGTPAKYTDEIAGYSRGDAGTGAANGEA